MKKSFLPFATLAFAAFALAACGSSQPSSSSVAPAPSSSAEPAPAPSSSAEPEKAVRPVKAFSLGETSKNAMNFDLYTAHRINLYENQVYEYIQTQITYGYSMNLGTSVITTYGTYVAGTTEDGVTAYTLNKAAEVVLSSYSNAGGFKLQINTADADQTYPTEMPAKTQGEQNMAQNKQDVIDAYGIGTVIYVGNDNVISFIDPNSEEEDPQKAEVTTPSGSVASVLKEFEQVQIVGNISGEGMVHYVVDCLHAYADNTYEYIQSDITFGYSMVLGTKTVVNFGNGRYGQGEDGITPYTLANADDVTLNSYSKAGGFSIAINTASVSQTYPTELPAKTQGEQNMAQNKQDVINDSGLGFTVYTSDANCVMSLNDPNAE